MSETEQPSAVTVYLGADHGGFALLAQLKQELTAAGYNVEDKGAFELNESDDYPQFAFAVAEAAVTDLQSGKKAFGVLLCKSSAGMVIAANKVQGVRAVAAFSQDQAVHARQHNDANVIAASGEWMDSNQITQVVITFLRTEFSHQDRHQRRIDQILAYEAERK